MLCVTDLKMVRNITSKIKNPVKRREEYAKYKQAKKQEKYQKRMAKKKEREVLLFLRNVFLLCF